MPAVVNLTSDNLETNAVHSRTVKVKLTFTTAATAAGILVTSDNPGVVPYYTAGSATPTAPTGLNFGSLTNGSGSVIGLAINDGAALTYRGGFFSFTSDLTPSITAVAPVKCGASSTGITAAAGVAVTLGLTGLTLLATATTQNLLCQFEYLI